MADGRKPKTPDTGAGINGRLQRASTENWESRRNKLGEELARRGMNKPPEAEEGPSQATNGIAYAIKLSSEFLAGIIVGIVLGLGFDQLVGTSPWGLIIFLFLGFAAGVMNVLRSVGRISPSQIGKQGAQVKNDNGKNNDDTSSE